MDRLVQAKHLGVEEAMANENDEMPGDINIKGDETHHHQHFHQPAATESKPMAAVVKKARSVFWPLVLSALLASGGIGALVATWLKPTPTATIDTDTDSDTVTEIDFPN
jgi:hypothetical protein